MRVGRQVEWRVARDDHPVDAVSIARPGSSLKAGGATRRGLERSVTPVIVKNAHPRRATKSIGQKREPDGLVQSTIGAYSSAGAPMSTRPSRASHACASSVSAIRLMPIVRQMVPFPVSSSSSATSARSRAGAQTAEPSPGRLDRPDDALVGSADEELRGPTQAAGAGSQRRQRHRAQRGRCRRPAREPLRRAATNPPASATERERERRGRILTPRPCTIAPMTNSRQDAVCLWLALVFPSSFVVHKYLGWEGTIALQRSSSPLMRRAGPRAVHAAVEPDPGVAACS